jgi:hypothetical protein
MKFRVILILGLAGALLPTAAGQHDERIQRLFRDAIEKMGGGSYLAVEDMVSNGHYFVFDRRGGHTNRIKFSDYTKLPDKSRYESGNHKKLLDVTVFNLEADEGWILEGQKEPREATPEEMQQFKNSAKHSIDNIFRHRYKDPENRLFYLGTGDGSDVRYEMVKLLDPENDEVTIYFDRMSKLPAKIMYRSTDKNGIKHRHVDEFSQWHVIEGVRTPLRLDGSIDGRQSVQIFILKISYNNNLQDAFFSKPIPPK